MEQQAATGKSMEAAGSNITHQKQKTKHGTTEPGTAKTKHGTAKTKTTNTERI